MYIITNINIILCTNRFKFAQYIFHMTRITIAKGDGIGPEIMDATLQILMQAGARIAIDEIEIHDP